MILFLSIMVSILFLMNVFFGFAVLYLMGKTNSINEKFLGIVKAVPELFKRMDKVISKHERLTKEILDS